MRFAMMVLFLLVLGGCADKTVNTPSDDFEDEFEAEFAAGSEFDPLSGYNRVMTAFNDKAIRYVLIPTAEGYRTVVPHEARISINNFFDNLIFPVRFTNNLLQGKVVNAFDETKRFIVNITVGFLGFANVADELYGMQKHDEDFGQTLGVWGVPAGPHIVLPLMGPTNIRDFSGMTIDSLISPTSYYSWRKEFNLFDNSWQSGGVNALRMVNGLSDFVPMYETMTKDAIDLYPFLKNMYEQRRDKLIKE